MARKIKRERGLVGRKAVGLFMVYRTHVRNAQDRRKTSRGEVTRSVWVRSLECTRKLHRFQRVVGLGAVVYLHLVFTACCAKDRIKPTDTRLRQYDTK